MTASMTVLRSVFGPAAAQDAVKRAARKFLGFIVLGCLVCDWFATRSVCFSSMTLPMQGRVSIICLHI